ncbi:hypothetical protein LPJ66_005750 [Kickxella alabastrina]|uniref:Uncharacterized protein n=1 Tax=Kickxella alabastrina TaxID=61397 RepID=A0ACC1IFY4_9FUNG|nr:hypothetical protein LPJ66_005750 [Kickxella alabastrina]
MQPVSANVSAATIDGVHTDVAVLGFANCVVALVTQLASVGSLIQAVVASNAAAAHSDPFADADADAERLAASADIPVDVKFLLGNPSASPASSLYQILAIHASQLKHSQNPGDSRPLLLGVALRLPRDLSLPLHAADNSSASPDMRAYMPLINAVAALVGECRVW